MLPGPPLGNVRDGSKKKGQDECGDKLEDTTTLRNLRGWEGAVGERGVDGWE